MTIAKGKRKTALKRHVDMCEAVTLTSTPGAYGVPEVCGVQLLQVGLESMAEMINKEPDREGVPQYFSIENGDAIVVHPRPDRKYDCRVLGAVLFEQ